MKAVIKIIVLICVSSIAQSLFAQKKHPLRLSEVKAITFEKYKKSLKKYDAFVEIENTSRATVKEVKKYYLSTKGQLDAVSLVKAQSFQTDRFFRFIKKGRPIKGKTYRAYQLSLGRKRKGAVRIDTDTEFIYLSYMNDDETLEIIDSIKVVFNHDPASYGRIETETGLTPKSFDVATPNFKNGTSEQTLTRKSFTGFTYGAMSKAGNTGFSDGTQFRGGWMTGISQRNNKAVHFTNTKLGLMTRGYNFDSQEKISTDKAEGTRDLKGNFQSLDLFLGMDVGVYAFDKAEIQLGLMGIVTVDSRQIVAGTENFLLTNGETLQTTFKNREDIEPSYSPDLGITLGVNYDLLPFAQLHAQWLYSFDIFNGQGVVDRNSATFYHSFQIGLSLQLKTKPLTQRRAMF